MKKRLHLNNKCNTISLISKRTTTTALWSRQTLCIRTSHKQAQYTVYTGANWMEVGLIHNIKVVPHQEYKIRLNKSWDKLLHFINNQCQLKVLLSSLKTSLNSSNNREVTLPVQWELLTIISHRLWNRNYRRRLTRLIRRSQDSPMTDLMGLFSQLSSIWQIQMQLKMEFIRDRLKACERSWELSTSIFQQLPQIECRIFPQSSLLLQMKSFKCLINSLAELPGQ